MNAFYDLSTERTSNKGFIGAIGWCAIAQYADHYELNGEETEEFLYLIGKMDDEYVMSTNKKSSRELKRASKSK